MERRFTARGDAGPRVGAAADRSGLPVQEAGVYVISVAARLVEMHPQTLRKYERVGLVTPSRTEGYLRLYSEQDITRLRMVKHLVDHWRMNLAGVEVAMGLLDGMLHMQRRLQPMIQASDDAEAVFKEVWEHVLASLALVEAEGETGRGTTPEGDKADGPSRRPRGRGGRGSRPPAGR